LARFLAAASPSRPRPSSRALAGSGTEAGGGDLVARQEVNHRYFSTATEAGVLRISIGITLFVTVLGVVFGLLAASLTILFDAVDELIDVAMTGLALLVARLIAVSTSGVNDKRLAERFSMGFWHLEPLVIEVGAAAFPLSANRRIRSEFLALDAKSWLMSSCITVVYLLAFGFGRLAQGTHMEWLTPYIDPVALGLVCLAVLPVPFGTVRRALADILLVTPTDLKQHVDEVARASVQRYGFDSHRACVARVGRGRQIELYFLISDEWPARALAEWDRIRDEISEAIGGDTPDRWLMIVFTTDPEWAE
jgi:predicted Co/Zn/Cd cation transporter (cation efflux family)